MLTICLAKDKITIHYIKTKGLPRKNVVPPKLWTENKLLKVGLSSEFNRT